MSRLRGARRRPGPRAGRTIAALAAAAGVLWLASIVLGASWNGAASLQIAHCQ